MTLRALTQATLALTLLTFATLARAHVSSVSVVQLDSDFDHLARTYQTRGTSAVADEIKKSLLDEGKLAAWREFVRTGGEVKVSVEIAESETKALASLQKRLERMGVPNLKFNGVVTPGRPDPFLPNEDEIRVHKWIRYGAGPAITLAASYFNVPEVTSGTWSDYAFVMMPMAAAGMATVVIEMIFANPTINNNVWKPLWNYGGPLTGTAVNIGVNFVVGLGLWASQVGAVHLPELFGSSAVPLAIVGFKQAVIEGVVGALLFNLFLGRYQTDLVYAEDQGSITDSQRYKLDTTGGVMVGGGRAAYWTLPHQYAYLGLLAQVGFFTLKTLPLTIKNYAADPLQDLRVARLLHGRKASAFERCGEALGQVGLINLPRLEKNMGIPHATPQIETPLTTAPQ